MSFSETQATLVNKKTSAKLSSPTAYRLFFFTLILAAFIVTLSSEASDPRIVMKVCDVTAYPNQQDIEICVMLDNYIDTLAGFNFWIQMDRPDLFIFQTAVGFIIDTSYWICDNWADTLCIDSTLTISIGPWDFIHVDTNEVLRGSFDTTGTLISGWEYVDTRSLSGFGTDILVVGIANLPSPPLTEGILPQQGGMLIKLIGTALDVPDTVLDRTVNLLVMIEFLDYIGFSTPDGTLIGIDYIQIVDTTCFVCTGWGNGGWCVMYQQVSIIPPGGCDSMIITLDSIPVLDSNQVVIINGSVEILMPLICGDMDNDGSSTVVISDLTYFVNYLFIQGPAPTYLVSADCNGDGLIDISDLTCWVCYIFLGCAPPICY